MLATAGRPPEDSHVWWREMKYDGMRAVTVVRGGDVRIFSRTLREVTGSFPEVEASVAALSAGRDMVIDGELISPDVTGAPSFRRLQRRMWLRAPTPLQIRSTLVQLVAFDLLELEGRSLQGSSYVERRARLIDLGLSGPLVWTSPAWSDVDPATLLVISREHRLEGILSKRADSAYRPGQRSRLWIKTVLRSRTDVVVAGWIPARGGDGIGALVLGAYSPDSVLTYVGRVGTGFTLAMRRSLRERLDRLARPERPLDYPKAGRSVRWAAPDLVGAVDYRDFVGTLRHPSWVGLRSDVAPHDVTLPDRAD
ncbi:ATP-dependent DNA ligase [Nocardia noduli]|uniref:ATP-dependent DNA ligase n=1 Tax=Nocardia noduli TaxID=2815722 RepID=UPI001C22364F|nr:ATP-dependent DNA ligase [Nocardia noduli]